MKKSIFIMFLCVSATLFGQETYFKMRNDNTTNFYEKIMNDPSVTVERLTEIANQMAGSIKIDNVEQEKVVITSKEDYLKSIGNNNLPLLAYLLHIQSLNKNPEIVIDTNSELLLNKILLLYTKKTVKDFLNFHKTEDQKRLAVKRWISIRKEMYTNDEFPSVTIKKEGNSFFLIDFISKKNKISKIINHTHLLNGDILIVVE